MPCQPGTPILGDPSLNRCPHIHALHVGTATLVQVDVWAVGVLAYEMLMSETPFFHEDEFETLKRIREASTDKYCPTLLLELLLELHCYEPAASHS